MKQEDIKKDFFKMGVMAMGGRKKDRGFPVFFEGADELLLLLTVFFLN